jgi:hypothetical protein
MTAEEVGETQGTWRDNAPNADQLANFVFDQNNGLQHINLQSIHVRALLHGVAECLAQKLFFSENNLHIGVKI